MFRVRVTARDGAVPHFGRGIVTGGVESACLRQRERCVGYDGTRSEHVRTVHVTQRGTHRCAGSVFFWVRIIGPRKIAREYRGSEREIFGVTGEISQVKAAGPAVKCNERYMKPVHGNF